MYQGEQYPWSCILSFSCALHEEASLCCNPEKDLGMASSVGTLTQNSATDLQNLSELLVSQQGPRQG